MSIKNYLNDLKTQDIYSLMLFTLYKCKEIPEYSTLSELAYVLDESNLLNICECFGGLTIKIPTIQDLENLICTLNLYKETHVNNKFIDDEIKNLDSTKYSIDEIKELYSKLLFVMEEFEFGDT